MEITRFILNQLFADTSRDLVQYGVFTADHTFRHFTTHCGWKWDKAHNSATMVCKVTTHAKHVLSGHVRHNGPYRAESARTSA